MATLLDDLILRPPGVPDHVIIWDKTDEQKAEDAMNGSARLGRHRHPSYAHSYEMAARMLIESSSHADLMDDVGLPIFFLQRHSTELLIKRFLGTVHEIHDYRVAAGKTAVLSKRQIDRLSKCHELKKLLNDLVSLSARMDLLPPPSGLQPLVALISPLELDASWSRYSYSIVDETRIEHLARDVETVIPIAEIHRQLRAVIDTDTFASAGIESYEGVLLEEWERLSRVLD